MYEALFDIQSDDDRLRYCRALPLFRLSDRPAEVQQLHNEADAIFDRLTHLPAEIDSAIATADYPKLATLEAEKTHGAALHRSALLKALRAEAAWLNQRTQEYGDLAAGYQIKWTAALKGLPGHKPGAFKSVQDGHFELTRLAEAMNSCEAVLTQIAARQGECHREIDMLSQPFRPKVNRDGRGEPLPSPVVQTEAVPDPPGIRLVSGYVVQYGNQDLGGPNHERALLPGFERDGSLIGWHAEQTAKHKAQKAEGKKNG